MKIEGRGLDEEEKREKGGGRREKGESDKRRKANWQSDYRIAMKVGKSRW